MDVGAAGWRERPSRKSFVAALEALINLQVVGAEGAVIEFVTRCSSAEEFIERFSRFTTETEVVVPASPHVSVGTAGHFVICLKDGSVMMKGRCEVTEIRPLAVAPGERPAAPGVSLMRLRLGEMDAHSCGIHLRLMERKASSPRRAPIPAPAPATPSPRLPLPGAPAAEAASAGPGAPEAVPVAAPAADESVTVVSDSRPPADGESPVVPSEATAIAPLPRPEARVAGAAFTLPANPLSDLDGEDLASFIELNFLETNRAGDARSPAEPNHSSRRGRGRRASTPDWRARGESAVAMDPSRRVCSAGCWWESRCVQPRTGPRWSPGPESLRHRPPRCHPRRRPRKMNIPIPRPATASCG